MLTRLTEAEFDRYAPWAYSLATTPAYASYPSYMDGIKTRDEFMTRARRGFEDEEILLFTYEGAVCGWIQWYAIPEENYAGTVSFLVHDHAAEAAAEFAAYVAQRFPGGMLDIGLDGANSQASYALEACSFFCIEHAVNHTMFFDRFQPMQPMAGTGIMQPGEEAAFIRLHNEPGMYWTAARILADLSNWRVYLHRDAGRAVGALVCRMDDWPEIFAIFFEENTFRADVYRSLMAACMNDVQAAGFPHMTYFEEDEQALPVLAELGFSQVGRYLAYRKVLKEA